MLQDLDHPGSYIQMLFVDLSSALHEVILELSQFIVHDHMFCVSMFSVLYSVSWLFICHCFTMARQVASECELMYLINLLRIGNTLLLFL